MWHWRGDGFGWWGFGMMGISMVLFWTLLIVIIIALVRHFGRTSSGTSAPRYSDERPSAERLLDERFARGEIDEEEYRARRAALRAD